LPLEEEGFTVLLQNEGIIAKAACVHERGETGVDESKVERPLLKLNIGGTKT